MSERPLGDDRLLDDLEAGRRRAALPDPTCPDGWRVDAALKDQLLGLFRDRRHDGWEVGGLFGFRDRAALPPRRLVEPDGSGGPAAIAGWRIVPGGTSVRRGAYLGPRVTIMPPSYVNVGAWVGTDSMIDSHVLVGSCAQIGDRVHLAAGVQIGGVLEPPGARPVIVEDDAFVGAGTVLLEGVLVQREAVIAAGVTLTGTSRVHDLVDERVLEGSPGAPLVIPASAVVVPGARAVRGSFGERHGLAVTIALLVKYRDPRTDARVALEGALR